MPTNAHTTPAHRTHRSTTSRVTPPLPRRRREAARPPDEDPLPFVLLLRPPPRGSRSSRDGPTAIGRMSLSPRASHSRKHAGQQARNPERVRAKAALRSTRSSHRPREGSRPEPAGAIVTPAEDATTPARSRARSCRRHTSVGAGPPRGARGRTAPRGGHGG